MPTNPTSISALERDLKARHGLSLAEYEVLVQLSEAPGRRLRRSDLTAMAGQSRSRLTHAVVRLESRGFAAPRRAVAGHVAAVRHLFVDVIDPDDLVAAGRAFRAVTERVPDTATPVRSLAFP